MLLAGTVAALGLLSKFTAAFAIAASVLVLAGRAVQRRSRRAVLSLLAFLAAGLALAGWFYVRNLVRYGDPFVGNWDLASGLHYLQEPAYRTASFYLQPAAAFFTNPEWAPWTSFSGGLYASFWADVFRVLGDGSAQRRYWIEVSLLAAALPTAAIGLGLLDTCRRAWRHLFATPDIALAAAAIWSVLGLAFFTLEVPFASTVKAFYLLWLVPLAAVFLVRGRGWIAEASPALGVLHDGVLVLFSVLSFFLYVI